MSRLAPGLIELNKGLDLNTAKIAAPEGTLLDSLNYEQVDFQGQKRIDGYARYDGSKGSYIDDFLRVELAPDDDIAVGSVLAGAKTEAFAVVVGVGDTYIDLAVIDETELKHIGSPVMWGVNLSLTPEEHYELILSYNQVLRNRATDLPGPVAGLHWFRDRLYAIASVPTLPSSGMVYPNEMLNGYPVLKYKDGIAYLGTADVVGDASNDVASFYEALTEQQASDELGSTALYGWHFKHLGWNVYFKDAVSLYGSLVALNQNKQNIGVQGPTSTEGSRGRFLHLTQGVTIQGRPTQARGWKSTNSPTSYELNPADLYDLDGDAVYADAYISWNGNTGAISAPGLAGAVPEYPANSTTKVFVP